MPIAHRRRGHRERQDDCVRVTANSHRFDDKVGGATSVLQQLSLVCVHNNKGTES